MIFAGEARRILAYRRPVDMRNSFTGLIALAQGTLHEDSLSGSLTACRAHCVCGCHEAI